MLLRISVDKKSLIPNMEMLSEAVPTAFFAVFVSFLVYFAGLNFIVAWIPPGFQVAFVVLISVWLNHIFKFKWGKN